MRRAKQVVNAYIVNGVKYPCNSKGIPDSFTPRQRQPQRNLNGLNEHAVEELFINSIRDAGFNEENSVPYKWLIKLLNVKSIKFATGASIVRFFGLLINDNVPREVYRRRPGIFYWMNERIETISKHLKDNEVQIVLDGNPITLSPAYLNAHSPSVKSEIAIDLFQTFHQCDSEEAWSSEEIISGIFEKCPQIDQFDFYF